jgi:lysozyme
MNFSQYDDLFACIKSHIPKKTMSTFILFMMLISLSCQSHTSQSEDVRLGSQLYLESESSMPLIPLSQQHHALEVCADGDTVFGIDVSRWQTEINWSQVAQAGVKYAIIRASNGTEIIDQYFSSNWENAQQSGILRGAYQYFRPGQDALAQAQLLVQRIREEGMMDLPPVIDVETTDDQPASVIKQKIRIWLDHVEAEFGVKPMIYTGFYFWRDTIGGGDEFADYPLWHPQYTNAACPRIADAWSKWKLWQYTSEGRVMGISGNVDLNRFNGTETDLIAWSEEVHQQVQSRDVIWGGRPRGQSFPLASQPAIELCNGEELSGELWVENTGTTSWDQAVILAPTPRDQPSVLVHPKWISPTRVTSVSQAPIHVGEMGYFIFSIYADVVGEYSQFFGLLREDTVWFADEGGPADDYIELKVNIRECPIQIVGNITHLSCSSVEGWAWDQAANRRWLMVELLIESEGEISRQRIRADKESLDINCLEEGPCKHGFYFDWPTTINMSNQMSVTVLAYDTQGAAYPLIQHTIDHCDELNEMGGEEARAGHETMAGEMVMNAGEVAGEAAGEVADIAGDHMMNHEIMDNDIRVGINSMAGSIMEMNDSMTGNMTNENQANQESSCTQFNPHQPLSIIFLLIMICRYSVSKRKT